jgi:hypothetical protein
VEVLKRFKAESTRAVLVLGQAVLVHDPLRLAAARGLPCVEHERFLEANAARVVCASHGPVRARGLPVAGSGDAVGAGAVGVLLITRAEEEPLALTLHERHRCSHAVNSITRQIETIHLLNAA